MAKKYNRQHPALGKELDIVRAWVERAFDGSDDLKVLQALEEVLRSREEEWEKRMNEFLVLERTMKCHREKDSHWRASTVLAKVLELAFGDANSRSYPRATLCLMCCVQLAVTCRYAGEGKDCLRFFWEAVRSLDQREDEPLVHSSLLEPLMPEDLR